MSSSTACRPATIAVLGMPNTGKSTLFNKLTGSHAHIGNWPGLTVDLMQASLELGGRSAHLIDLPGIYDLRGHSEDEAVVRRFLAATAIDLVVVILNASQLDRQLRLALQVQELELPTVVLLNMADEAKRFGVSINLPALCEHLGLPVLLVSAKYGRGLGEARQAIRKALEPGPLASAPPDPAGASQSLEQRLALVDGELPQRMATILAATVQLPPQWRDRLTRRLDRVLLHPLLGLPLFFATMLLMFQGIYAIGVPIQGLLSSWLSQFGQGVLAPLLANWGLPAFVQGFLMEGLYQGIGTVSAFLPVIFLFFLAMGVVEDSGYLSWAAYLMDR